ncbi:MAG: class I SAM-dependent methyltransferase [bacterium]
MDKTKIEEELKSKIKIPSDPSLNLERNSFLRKLSNIVLIPILNSLPIKSRGLIKKSNKAVNDIVNNATSHKALEILYHNGNKGGLKKTYEKLSHLVWFNTNNSKGVRNRLKIVKNEIKDILRNRLDHHETISIVSIAAGSARAVIEALEETKTDIKNVNVYFVDKSPEALTYSKELLKEHSIQDKDNYSFNWINATVNEFLDSVQERFSVVEMVGLMDYFDDERAEKIFNKINSVMKEGGYFITANINHNSEKRFITKAIGWPMIYRSGEHLARVVHQAGFGLDEITTYYEPLRIHSIVVSRKS